MRSSRSKKALAWHAILIVAGVLTWRCATGVLSPPAAADHGSFQRERRNMRQRLMAQTGDSGVAIDDNTILLGVVPNSYGLPNASRDPSEMHVRQGTSPKLTWMCWDGRFQLTFVPTDAGPVTPLVNGQTQDRSGDSLPSVASAAVRNDLPRGSRYSFTVHIELPDGGAYDDKYCPPIIID